MPSFGPIAGHYDLLMANVPYDMWAGYYRLLLAQIEAKPHELLDVCCGTGTLAEMMTRSGFQVEGFDLSPEMIEIAKRKAEEHNLPIKYTVADATSVDLGRQFDGAYSFFDSLNYITTSEGLREAIHRVGEHLRPGGSFVFDLNTSYAFEQNMFDQEDLRKRALIRYKWSGKYDKATRIIEVDMTFWRNDETIVERHVQRAHRDEEVREYLEEAGFVKVRAFDSYTLDPPRKRSDRLHYTAIRNPSA